MKLSTLEQIESFALLGPGYGGGGWLLLTGLRAGRGQPRLVYAPFECSGAQAYQFVARAWKAASLDLDVAPEPCTVSLHSEGYRQAVERIRRAIAAGDVYQVNYTVRAAVQVPSGATLLSRVCRDGVPRFAAWVRLPWGEEIVSASPELFFETRGSSVRSEPMKGTARVAAAGVLETSDKDRAELAMITDLVRNDLTPVCRPGTVRVGCARRTLALSYAVQTVSDVIGELAAGTSPIDVLTALHPGGSVTGAPKRAALALIRELEVGPRDAYCGALGLVHEERATFGLLIRTAQRQGSGWTYGVGGGIVYDSSASAELDELRIKLGALRCDTPS